MTYRVVTDFERPPADLVRRASQTFAAVTGGFAGPRQIVDTAIKPLQRKWRLCGPAFTVRSEFNEDLLMGYVAAKYVRPGDILVVDGGGRTDVACWGASMAGAAREAGCAGIVLYGMALTADLLIDREHIPVFARGTAPITTGQDRPGWLNGPVACGGVIVNPGYIVLGDIDGVVVLPRERAATIVAASEKAGAKSGVGRANPAPYRDRTDSEERLRALPGVEWE